MKRDPHSMTVIGPRNVPLYDGAQELLAGNDAEGVRLTHKGLQLALGSREEEAALSNLCAGYIRLALYDNALQYCDLLLARNDKSWRGYNNRAVIYIKTKQWEKAEQDLIRGEELHPDARTLKIARSMYMDAVHPVAPEIEIDDRQRQISAEPNPQ
jgi:tetratricopeptide (TPR) repeat protein